MSKVIMSAAVLTADRTSVAMPCDRFHTMTVEAVWTNNDTPTGVLYARWKGSTSRNLTIPSSAVHAASNATLSSGALSIAGGGYAVLILKDFPPNIEFFYDRTSGGSGDTMTITCYPTKEL